MADESEDPPTNIDFQLDIDSRLVDNWSRTTLFPKVKFLYEDKDLEVGGRIYAFFTNTCMGTHADQLSDTWVLRSLKNTYRRRLWDHCRPRIRKTLSVKRSGVTNQMGGKFMGKQ